MTPNSHDEIISQLVDYADGELPEARAAAIAEHVAECAACRERLEALRRSLELARMIWEDGEARLDAGGLANAARDASPADARGARRFGNRRRLAAWSAVAAALALFIGWHLIPERSDDRPPAWTDSPTAEEIRYEIEREGVASQLLMAADLLAEQPGGREYACERYRYIAASYSNSPAGLQSLERLQTLCDERIEQ